MKKFYVYFYLREDLTPYYVGKGSGKRYKSKNRLCNPPKDPHYIFMAKENLSEEDAFKWEIYYISYYGRKDIGTGILRNMTDGGDGVSGYKMSEDIIMKRGESRSYDWIVRTPEGEILEIKNLKRFCLENNIEHTGLHATSLHKTRHSQNYQARKVGDNTPFYTEYTHNTAKKIIATNILTGEETIYHSISECAKQNNCDAGAVSRIVNGKMNKTGNYTFRYFDEELAKESQKFKKERINNFQPRSMDYVIKLSKRFIATDPDGNEYEGINLREFCRNHNLTSNTMTLVANGKRNHHKGWTCRYIEE